MIAETILNKPLNRPENWSKWKRKKEEAKSILERLKDHDIDSDEACDRLFEIIEVL